MSHQLLPSRGPQSRHSPSLQSCQSLSIGDHALQNTGGIKHKWEERCRMGVHLGRSPFHARCAALVLNLSTGRVSPPFHIQHDPGFHTVKRSFGGQSPSSPWQVICGFARTTPEAAEQREPTNEQPVQFALEPNQSQMNAVPDGTPEQLQAEVLEQAKAEAPLRRSTRVRKPVIGNRLVDLLSVQVVGATVPVEETESAVVDTPAQGELFSYSTLFPLHDEEDLDLDLIQACAASADPITLHHPLTPTRAWRCMWMRTLQELAQCPGFPV